MDIITLALCKRIGKSKADINGIYPNLIAGGVVESEVRDEDFSNKVTEHTGTANINSIKGNTLVWNQLVRNGNFIDTSYWNGNGTKTVSNNELTYTKPARWNSLSNSQLINLVSGHKYLAMFEAYCENDTMSVFWQTGTGTGDAVYAIPSGTSWQKHSLILTCAQTTSSGRVPGFDNNSANETIFHLRNYIFVDLTQMGLDISNPSEFTSLFSLPYYDYNQGSLLSFNGNGIKTVGKNIFDGVLQNGSIDQYGQEQTQANRYRTDFLRVFPSTRYVISVDGVIKNVNIFYYDINKNFISSVGGSLVTTPSDCAYMRFYYDQSILNVNLQLEMLKSGNNPTPYEPYVTNTTNLPISTYFPNGMKSAGSVYDELTPTKAITRVGSITLNGSESWGKEKSTWGTWEHVYYCKISTIIYPSYSGSRVYGKGDRFIATSTTKMRQQLTVPGYFCINQDSNGIYVEVSSDITTTSEFIAWLANNPFTVYYELASETEVDVNLDLSYKTYEGGTEQLLPENGSVPVTSPMKTNVEFDFDENINALLGKMLNMIAPVETSPTSNAYSVGQYLIYDYVLYKVTSAIASGGTITIGTNVEATTIASVLESL